MFGNVGIATPPRWFFGFPPSAEPLAVPAPTDGPHWRSPFPINPFLYNALLEPVVPITFAATYFLLVKIANQINRRRQYRPWPTSRTRAFFCFAVAHNIFLAVYSAITCIAMIRAMHVSIPSITSEDGFAPLVDALCKINGPRGYGDAVIYDPFSSTWGSKNSIIRLGPHGGTPDATDVGRIWNEGLAFWGWLFYLSKFYEIFDTFIILAKGKRSATLQTYHHTGAMLCMWAGIRYMSPPIWMFVLVNSFIHTLMYIFYTATTLGVKVPAKVKRPLTTLQIAQFILGVSYAGLHLFVIYDIPVSTPFKIASMLTDPSRASDAAADLLTTAKQAALSSGNMPPWIKRLVYRAAGAEGLAESVQDSTIYGHQEASSHLLDDTDGPTSRQFGTSTHYETIHCLDTQGQAFAVWLNLAYLAPLTFLFARFFVKSYIRNEKPRSGLSTAEGRSMEGRRWSRSIEEAAKQTREVVEELGGEVEEAIDDTSSKVEAIAKDGSRDVGDIVNKKSSKVAHQAKGIKKKLDATTKVKSSQSIETTENPTQEARSVFQGGSGDATQGDGGYGLGLDKSTDKLLETTNKVDGELTKGLDNATKLHGAGA